MKIEQYWSRKRRDAIAALVLLLLVPLVLIATVREVAEIVSTSLDQLSVPARAAHLQVIATVGNLLLGAVLVAATCFYAWVTRATLGELIETRHAARRPSLLLQAKSAAMKQPTPDLRLFEATIALSNVGMSVTISPRITIRVPEYPPDGSATLWLQSVNSISTTIYDLPPVLAPGAEVAREVSLPIKDYRLPTGRVPGFMEVRVVFEDMDRNLYELTHEYDLFSHDHGRLGWILLYDGLAMVPAKKRDFVRDDENVTRSPETPARKIYERAGFR